MSGEVTIASLNLQCGFSGNGQPYDVQDAIRGLEAQVIALQETWSVEDSTDQVAEAAGALGAQLFRIDLSQLTTVRRLLGIPAVSPKGRFGMAVLSTLPVISHEVLELGRLGGDVVHRRAQILTIRLPDGPDLRLAATHLTYRLMSPLQLWRLTRALQHTPVPTVIAGDLNMPRTLAGRTPGYSPAVQSRTWPAGVPLLQLDHVLIGRDVDVVDGTVLPAVGSDHRPVRAQLRVRSPNRSPVIGS